MEGMMDAGVLDDIIRRLLEGKGGKQVQLSEVEIRQLCVNARQIFLSQPNLLPVRAPIRICGLSLSLSLSLYFSHLHLDVAFLCFWEYMCDWIRIPQEFGMIVHLFGEIEFV